jgi:hypothetical protein
MDREALIERMVRLIIDPADPQTAKNASGPRRRRRP